MKDHRKPINDMITRLYSLYFGIQIGNQDKVWAPHIVCKICIEHLRQWEKGTRKSLKFGISMRWREQKNHHDDCYFCITNLAGINKNNRSKWKYPNISSATRPIPHSETVPILGIGTVFHREVQECDDDEMEISEEEDYDFEHCGETLIPKTFSQGKLSDLIRDLDLSKERAELLASRLKEKSLSSGVKIIFYRTREQNLLQFFSSDENLVFCHNVNGLMTFMGLKTYHASDWRLFIDSSKRSLKAVLLHNGNRYAPIPLAHSTSMKEEYKVFACDSTVADDVTITKCMIGNENENKITMDEIMKALKPMKDCKAARYDRVSSELSRGVRNVLVGLLYQLFYKYWKSRISLFANGGKHDRDIQRRRNKGNKVNGTLLAIVNSKNVSQSARLSIHNEVLILTLTCGSESWRNRPAASRHSLRLRPPADVDRLTATKNVSFFRPARTTSRFHGTRLAGNDASQSGLESAVRSSLNRSGRALVTRISHGAPE
ncbi:hypothetical protein EVAR_56623_1 [Eumeta japonica]|uniref:Uncharacterized protein n=1 Tax=Eumeta variegata TaxID=151549 RepID=A0A4C1XJS6_EUMVA|nr:hypothetical protein EVAR_56623_1 [Eumeta japonica]